jgi:sorbitol-specific phosphotransferase system component IIA
MEVVLESNSGSIQTGSIQDICIDECRRTYLQVSEVLDYCLRHKGSHVNPSLLTIIYENLLLTQQTYKALLMGYSQRSALAELTAMSCNLVREKLTGFQGNIEIDQTVEALKNCADSCRQL